jgi:hypothetical protein
MFRKIALLLILAGGLAVLAPSSWGAYLRLGAPAPAFLVESGDNQKLTLGMLRGKVIVCFYEARQVIRKNIELKNELKRLYRVQPPKIQAEIFRLVVIDCSKALWPAIPLWKSKLCEHSRKEGFPIYGDWTGRMLADYHMKGEESNLIVIDKRGIIRYSASGRISRGKFEEIKNLLLSMVQEG